MSRPAILAVAMFVWFALPMGVRTARAAGCHLPDRPVLGLDRDERADRHGPAWAPLDRGESAPPLLTRVPCSAEIPGTTVIAMASVPADGAPALFDASLSRTGQLHLDEDVDGRDPHPFRLDRPPR